MPFTLPFLLLPSEQEPKEAEEELMVSSLQPEVWAALFRQHWDPLLPWLHQELHIIFGTQWWSAMAVENLIMSALCDTGLDRKALIQQLWPAVGDRTEMFSQGLTDIAACQWGEEAY
ncbi:hypothetical protein CIB84_015676 [Bambusicola thoracicus]|uniref:Uncharacterized protein n=1 Tax=Bambusicola thoracicus TaxID=9083 RepID=A0A2P4S8Z9_BAMTH|nr:hypothetical protein CIB84_015676 [Bambusicola thoracicus]